MNLSQVLCESQTDIPFLCLVAATINFVMRSLQLYYVSTIQHMIPMANAQCLEMPRSRDIKYYDKDDLDRLMWISKKQHGDLQNVSLVSITNDKSVVTLKYDFIKGDHQIMHVKQLVGVLNTLMKLHHAKSSPC